MRVAINKPCHENWDAMTPNEQGSFCLSCQKTVVDFSTKTTTEIKSFFNALTGKEKVCGRFKEDQLTELTFDDFFERFRNWVVPKKLAVILFFVFGMSLFSCQSTGQDDDSPLMGDVAVENTNHTTATPVMLAVNTVDGDTAKTKPVKPVKEKPEQIKMGEVKATPEPKEVELMIKGDVYYEPTDTMKVRCVKKDTVVKKEEKMIMGKIRINK